jgi:hypothetical protein
MGALSHTMMKMSEFDTNYTNAANDADWAGLSASSCCESCYLTELADPNNVALA